MNKENRSISEYMLGIKSIVNFLLVVGDSISEHDQINFILDGLSKEYNLFVMQIYGSTCLSMIYDVKTLIYVKEIQLHKFWKELVMSNVYAMITHSNQQIGGVCDRFFGALFGGWSHGKGRISYGN